MDIYAHVSKRQTEKTAIRFADFMKESDQKNELFRYGKNAKSRLSLLDSLQNVDISMFLYFFGVCLFETVFFVEAVHTAVCSRMFLFTSIERVRIRRDFDT